MALKVSSLLSLALLPVLTYGESASFTYYGGGDQNGSGNCKTSNPACGPDSVDVSGLTAAISQNAYGAGPGDGKGPACGKCYKLTFDGGNSTVVTVNNLCPAQGNEKWCSIPPGGKNSVGKSVHFDLCSDTGGKAFLPDGTGTGEAEEVPCGSGSSSDSSSDGSSSGGSSSGGSSSGGSSSGDSSSGGSSGGSSSGGSSGGSSSGGSSSGGSSSGGSSSGGSSSGGSSSGGSSSGGSSSNQNGGGSPAQGANPYVPSPASYQKSGSQNSGGQNSGSQSSGSQSSGGQQNSKSKASSHGQKPWWSSFKDHQGQSQSQGGQQQGGQQSYPGQNSGSGGDTSGGQNSGGSNTGSGQYSPPTPGAGSPPQSYNDQGHEGQRGRRFRG